MQQHLTGYTRQPGLSLPTQHRKCKSVAVRPTRNIRVRCAQSDYSIKIQGDVRKVYKYVSDLTNRPSWDSATLEAVTIKGRSAIGVGTSFALVQTPLPAVKIPVTYTVAEYLPPKKLVLTGQAEMYKAKKTFVFMEHPNQPQQTIVREMFEIEMKDWKAMIPMMEAQLAKKEQTAFKKLEALLNGSKSPLQNIVLTAEELKPVPKQVVNRNEPGAQKGWGFGSMLNNIFSSSGASSSAAANGGDGDEDERDVSYMESGSGAEAVRTAVVSDALGYYRVLGLQPSDKTTSDDIKAAFRKAAKHVHPDRLGGADDSAKQGAQLQFQILQAAYETLKDPEKRRRYDMGGVMSMAE